MSEDMLTFATLAELKVSVRPLGTKAHCIEDDNVYQSNGVMWVYKHRWHPQVHYPSDHFRYIALPKDVTPVAPMMTSDGEWVIVLPGKAGIDVQVKFLLQSGIKPTSEELNKAIELLDAADKPAPGTRSPHNSIEKLVDSIGKTKPEVAAGDEEVTWDMIEAGMQILLQHHAESPPERIVQEIYKAMIAKKPSGAKVVIHLHHDQDRSGDWRIRR